MVKDKPAWKEAHALRVNPASKKLLDGSSGVQGAVTDGTKYVTGLKQDDFDIFEDGTQQAIQTMRAARNR